MLAGQKQQPIPIEDFLSHWGLREQYLSIFSQEKLSTLEDFRQMVKLDNKGLTSTFLERARMPCGDFAKLAASVQSLSDCDSPCFNVSIELAEPTIKEVTKEKQNAEQDIEESSELLQNELSAKEDATNKLNDLRDAPLHDLNTYQTPKRNEKLEAKDSESAIDKVFVTNRIHRNSDNELSQELHENLPETNVFASVHKESSPFESSTQHRGLCSIEPVVPSTIEKKTQDIIQQTRPFENQPREPSKKSDHHSCAHDELSQSAGKEDSQKCDGTQNNLELSQSASKYSVSELSRVQQIGDPLSKAIDFGLESTEQKKLVKDSGKPVLQTNSRLSSSRISKIIGQQIRAQKSHPAKTVQSTFAPTASGNLSRKRTQKLLGKRQYPEQSKPSVQTIFETFQAVPRNRLHPQHSTAELQTWTQTKTQSVTETTQSTLYRFKIPQV